MGEMLLLVDDDAAFREVYRELLLQESIAQRRAGEGALAVAEDTMRTLAVTVSVEPTARTSPDSRVRSSLTCSAGSMSPISSRNRLPPSAATNSFPRRCAGRWAGGLRGARAAARGARSDAAAFGQPRGAAALEATGGNKSQAAQRLGLSRQGLLNKVARHQLK